MNPTSKTQLQYFKHSMSYKNNKTTSLPDEDHLSLIEAIGKNENFDYVDAISLCEEILLLNPENPETLSCLLNSKYFANKTRTEVDKTIESLKEIARKNPNNFYCCVFCANILEEEGRVEEAITYYKRISNLPEGYCNGTITYRLFLNYLKTKKYSEALNLVNLLDSNIVSTEAFFFVNAVAASLEKNYNRAINLLHLYIKTITPEKLFEKSDILLFLAKRYYFNQQYEEALMTLEQNDFEIFNKVELLEFKAEVYEKTNNFESALAIYRTLIIKCPNRLSYYLKSSNLCKSVNDFVSFCSEFSNRPTDTATVAVMMTLPNNKLFKEKLKESVFALIERKVFIVDKLLSHVFKAPSFEFEQKKTTLNIVLYELQNELQNSDLLYLNLLNARVFLSQNNLIEASKILVDLKTDDADQNVDILFVKAKLLKLEKNYKEVLNTYKLLLEQDPTDCYVQTKLAKYCFRCGYPLRGYKVLYPTITYKTNEKVVDELSIEETVSFLYQYAEYLFENAYYTYAKKVCLKVLSTENTKAMKLFTYISNATSLPCISSFYQMFNDSSLLEQTNCLSKARKLALKIDLLN
ncbi:hypothetical protein EIN_372140 [Entamoeba invadens IP1]|uniref:Uncharacterized protein n=1 Tax=Entamoeba invadens IP1 TaxID=370355 RepID=A0A0A1UGL6_ENTIV|nr:hypothetical protein EIN_372140 [Entamoeba invadens IP1]ELP92792.1 hypothetical protein EIN_372140 [Entamoeba invadens IP1]|eukprot:XP_004259563.1 hypothetical protein EIN_372140 [Entamoeba invadens IP1]